MVVSCNPFHQETEKINQYLFDQGHLKISDGKVILISSGGCKNCADNAFNYLVEHDLTKYFEVIIVTSKAFDQVADYSNDPKLLIDSNNNLEKLSIKYKGFIFIDYQDSEIDTIFNFTPLNDYKSLEKFSKR